MGGPAILKKKWGDLSHLGGPNGEPVNLGGRNVPVIKKYFTFRFT